MYGEQFGAPRFTVHLGDGKIVRIDVRRGAPCGATWPAVERLVGLTPGEAAVRLGLEAQFFCSADPAGWDPISGKSPVHLAGELHSAALKAALLSAGMKDQSVEER